MKIAPVLAMLFAIAMAGDLVETDVLSYWCPEEEVDVVNVEPCDVDVDVVEIEIEPSRPRPRQKVVEIEFEEPRPRRRKQKVVEIELEAPRPKYRPQKSRLELIEFLKAPRHKYPTSAASRVPPYSEAEAEHKETRRFVAARLNFQVPNLEQRNYVGLLTAIQGISDTMARGATYDEAFAQRNAYINLGRQLPVQARDIILIKIRNSVQKTDAIRYLLNQVCGPDVSETCDIKVENAIRGSPRLQAQGALLVELGILAKYWNERAVAWVDASRLNAVEDYFNRNKNTLRPLFLQAVKVIRLEQSTP